MTGTLKGKAVTFLMLNSKHLAKQMQIKWRERKLKRTPELPEVALSLKPREQVTSPGSETSQLISGNSTK